MKTDLSIVHPELRQVAKKFPQVTYSSKNLIFRRFIEVWAWVRKIPRDIRVENIRIPSQDDNHRIRLRVYRPRSLASPAPLLLWIHGGGYFLGIPDQDDSYAFQFARELGLVVASVDYRLAPENPFPTPLDDCYTALKWAAAHASQLGIDPQRIAIGGESAGGGLAAALAQLAHDRNEIRPCFQLLIYPMLDDRTSLRTDLPAYMSLIWNQASNRFGWESYLGKNFGADTPPAYAVPARRADLSGLPPAWIGVGTVDQFLDEDTAYAERLKSCGVPCELVIVQGAFHGFDTIAPQALVVQDFQKSQVAALKRAL